MSLDEATRRAYRLALEVARWLRDTRWPPGSEQQREEAVAAAIRVFMHLGTSVSQTGESQLRHHREARAHVIRIVEILEPLVLPGHSEALTKAQSIHSILAVKLQS